MNRFAYINPLVVTGLLLAPMIFLFIADALTPELGLTASRDILSTLAVLSFLSGAAQLAWVWSLYEQALTRARQLSAGPQWARPVFAGVALTMGTLSLWSWLAPEQVSEVQRRAEQSGSGMISVAALILGVVGVLSCHWFATRALIAAETPVPRAHSWTGTFLLMLYLPIGVWFLRPRLMALRYQ